MRLHSWRGVLRVFMEVENMKNANSTVMMTKNTSAWP